MTRARDDAVTPTLRSPAAELGPRATKTIAKILDATKAIFQTRGYGGTTIDEIAREADISRASFYTYFPTKRDVLLAVGADSATVADDLVATYAERGRWSTVDARDFVHDYLEMLDAHGAFAFAWTQAAWEDDELRTAGQARHLANCRRLGSALGTARGEPFDDVVAVGLLWSAAFERVWSYTQLYDSVDSERLERELTDVLCASLGLR